MKSSEPEMYISSKSVDMELKFKIFSIIFLFVSSSAADPSYKCHQNISSWQGNLSFPLSFGDNVNRKEEVPCVWSLSVSSGNIIKLIVTELRVGNDTNCNKSYLEIYDGDTLMVKSLCWLNGSFSLLSTSSGLSIRLVVSSNDLYRTFRAHHQGICSLSVNPWSGVLSSPNYPHPYLSNQNCSWRFPDRGDGYRTMFTIKHLDLDGKSDCQKNLLTISSSTVNMVICSKSPTSLSLDSSSVEVKFQSKENSNKSTGFEIEYVVEDVDECTTNQHNCHKEAKCRNTVGSYVCECNMYHTGNGTFCTDIDECSFGSQVCKPHSICTNTEGAYDCECKAGFVGNGHVRCVNVDECEKDAHDCDVNAKCTDTVGSYICTCAEYYTGNGTYCEDINECLHDINVCDANAKCLNKIGSYECICDAGYTGNGENCFDINECLSSIPLCHDNANCQNIPGSFICKCDLGFTGHRYNCSDIDECSLNKNVCHPNAKCDNTIGSFECHCISGYTGDGCNCTDVDECSSNKDICHSNAECNNTIGSFDCCCLSGYSGNGFNCTDLDECSLNNNTCHQYAKCINSIGSFQCNCLSGYTGGGWNCSDSDECYLNTSACHSNAKCSNSIGSYRCNCDTGFTGNGFNCTDLDECTSLPKEICHENADCINMIGSYRCQCVTGFIGNGFNCTDIDECCSKKKSCHPDAECMNVVGSFYCRCRHGYTGDGFNCVDLDECKLKINLCDSNARCININGSYICQCDDGYSGDGFHCLDILNGSTYCSLEESQDVTWETTVVGDVRTHSCPNEHLGNCSRKCSDQGIWEYPDMSNCVSPKFVSLDNQFHEDNVAKEDVLHGSDVLSNLTSGNRTKLYGGDIIASVRILKRLVFNSNRSRLSNFSEQDIEKFTTSYSKTVSNLLDTEKFPIWKGVKKRKLTALTMVTNVEEFGDTLMKRQIEIRHNVKSTTTLESSSYTVFTSMENIEMLSQAIDVRNFSGLVFGKSEGDYGAVSFPGSLYGENVGENGKERYSGIFSAIYRNLATIVNNQENSPVNKSFDTDVINSVIVTAKVIAEVSQSFNNLVEPVILIFKHVKQQSDARHQCVYLNTRLNESNKVWLKAGCSVYSSNSTHTVCHCFHLTNFALLMDMHGVQNTMSSKHDKVLTVLSYITCSISMMSAFVAIIIFHILRLTSNRISIHKHLAVNIFLTQLVFLIASHFTSTKWLCKTVAVFLHFLLLALFSWMLVEGLFMYKSLIKVFSSRAHGIFKKYLILGYGIPLVIVVISCGLFWDDYGTSEKMCWITQDVIISALVPPLGVVILINAVILGMVIRVLLHPSSIRNIERDVVKEVKSSLKASITLLPLLGLCWIFGFLQFNQDTLVFSYAFVILNASQGFCFLIFHCWNSNEVKSAWTKRSRKVRRSEYQSHHSISSTTVRVPNSASLQDISFLSLSTLISRDESLAGVHQQSSQGDQLKTEVENPDVQNQNSPNIFGTSDFDGADLLKDLKNNVQTLKRP